MTTPRTTSDRSADALPTSWQRLLALSGIPFAVLLVVGFFLSGGDTPDYTAADQEWTTWAENNELKSRIGAFLTLIAGFVCSCTSRGRFAPCSGLRRLRFAALGNSRGPRSRVP
jgi:hypothetical protein